MKFTGEGHVEMRPPRDVEDLKAYTALSLSLQRPELSGRGDNRRRRQAPEDEGDMFVLYLGNKNVSGYRSLLFLFVTPSHHCCLTSYLPFPLLN